MTEKEFTSVNKRLRHRVLWIALSSCASLILCALAASRVLNEWHAFCECVLCKVFLSIKGYSLAKRLWREDQGERCNRLPFHHAAKYYQNRSDPSGPTVELANRGGKDAADLSTDELQLSFSDSRTTFPNLSVSGLELPRAPHPRHPTPFESILPGLAFTPCPSPASSFTTGSSTTAPSYVNNRLRISGMEFPDAPFSV